MLKIMKALDLIQFQKNLRLFYCSCCCSCCCLPTQKVLHERGFSKLQASHAKSIGKNMAIENLRTFWWKVLIKTIAEYRGKNCAKGMLLSQARENLTINLSFFSHPEPCFWNLFESLRYFWIFFGIFQNLLDSETSTEFLIFSF